MAVEIRLSIFSSLEIFGTVPYPIWIERVCLIQIPLYSNWTDSLDTSSQKHFVSNLMSTGLNLKKIQMTQMVLETARFGRGPGEHWKSPKFR